MGVTEATCGRIMLGESVEAEGVRVCACSPTCQTVIDRGGNGRRVYAEGHRMRAYRDRVSDAMTRAGLPANPSLKAAQTHGPTNQRIGDAERRPTRARRPDSGVRLYLTRAEAAALARGDLPEAVAAKARRKIEGAAVKPIDGQMTVYDYLEGE